VSAKIFVRVEAEADPPPPEEAGADPAPAGKVGTDSPPGKGDRFVILAIRRGRRTLPMTLKLELRAGDVAVVAVYGPEREEALAQLAAAGWQPHEATETEPQAEPPAAPSRGHGWT
jgi:hypothetical protein